MRSDSLTPDRGLGIDPIVVEIVQG
ncbi:MAG: hypothetical protein QOE71_1130, partial [Pseudonocardiales bacterium]|nr:hypothetical protein [Pseudonocardiales bacterium]